MMSKDSHEKTVPDHLAGLRLDQALAQMFPEYSRSRLKSWVLQGHVTVDDRALRPRDSVSGGERILLVPQAEAVLESRPEPLDLELVLEDDAILIVNKPAGLVVHPGAGNLGGTLMNGLLHLDPGLAEIPRAGIIHRLDKDTSGLLLVARTLRSHAALVRALAERKIRRSYLAICTGVLTGGGTIDAPIGRHPVDRLRMAVVDIGKPAVTRYRVIERFAAHTYIRVELETGRTHQIRVHFAHRRHPLVGDPVYGGRLAMPKGANEATRTALAGFRRQALHAERLAFTHPDSGSQIDVSTPPPADFTALLEALRTSAATGTDE